MFNLHSDNGYIGLGGFSISWGNPVDDLDLPGFCAINLGRHSLEFGDIDQGKPGIYVTSYADGEISNRRALWEAP